MNRVDGSCILPLFPSYKLDDAPIAHRALLVMENIQFWNQ
jgi:hypothetical protein